MYLREIIKWSGTPGKAAKRRKTGLGERKASGSEGGCKLNAALDRIHWDAHKVRYHRGRSKVLTGK